MHSMAPGKFEPTTLGRYPQQQPSPAHPHPVPESASMGHMTQSFPNQFPQHLPHQSMGPEQTITPFATVPAPGDSGVLMTSSSNATPQVPRPQFVSPLMWQQVMENTFATHKADIWTSQYDESFMLDSSGYTVVGTGMAPSPDMPAGL